MSLYIRPLRIRVYYRACCLGLTPGIFTNLFDRDDRETVGGWYLHFQTSERVLELYGNAR